MSSTLPAPDEIALQHSRALVARICEEAARHGGSLAFDRYMELALYDPAFGYYTGGSRKFGAEGDFITAPESSPLFAQCLATQVAEVQQKTDGDTVLEFGAGSGVLAADMLQRLEEIGNLPQTYLILELSAGLRERQSQTIRDRVPHLVDRVSWVDALPGDRFSGVVIANEVLDAFPVSRFRVRGEEIDHLEIVCEGDGLHKRWKAAPQDVRSAVDEIKSTLALNDGYSSEICLRVAPWINAVADCLGKGMLLLVDYGYPRSEYYHPQRTTGTTQCYYRHRVHDDPLHLPGLQDITAHVDFTGVAEAAIDAGLSVEGYANQAQFLIGCGLDDLIAAAGGGRNGMELVQQAKRLVLPTEMGEHFKAMALTKGVSGPWRGFVQPDLRARL